MHSEKMLDLVLMIQNVIADSRNTKSSENGCIRECGLDKVE